MTTRVTPTVMGVRAGPPARTPPWQRRRALVALELRRQWRYGVVLLFGILTLAWTALLLVLAPAATPLVAGWLLLLDTAVFGATVAGALVLLDRGHGMLAVLAASPARLGEFVAARVLVLAGLVLCSAVPLALVAGLPLPGVLAGAGLTAVLTTLLAIALAVRCRSVVSFLVGLPLLLLPLLLPLLAAEAGFGRPWVYLAPTTGAMDLVRGQASVPAAVAVLVWLAVAGAAVAGLARRSLRRYAASGPPQTLRRVAPPRWRPRRLGPAGGPVPALLASDLTRLARDPLLLLIVASPALLGLVVRFGYPPAAAWLVEAHRFDLAPYRPLLLAVAVVLHVPLTFGMIGALMVLDDADDRALLALRVSPVTLAGYLRYRGTLTALAALVGLALAVPLSGLAVPGQWRLLPALMVAALLAPLMMFATLALARNKVEGVAVLKLLGLPLYAPLASWWLPAAASWPLAVLPPWWVLAAMWTGWLYALAGAGISVVALLLLARRARARLATV